MMTTELTREQLEIQTAIAAVYPDVEIRWEPLEWDAEWLINLGGYADLAKHTEHPSLILPFTYLVDYVGRRHSIQVNCSLVKVEAGGLGAVQDCFLLESFRLTSTGRKYKRQSDVFGKISGRSRFPPGQWQCRRRVRCPVRWTAPGRIPEASDQRIGWQTPDGLRRVREVLAWVVPF